MIRWMLLSICALLPSVLAAERVTLGTLPRKVKAAGFTATVSMEAVGGNGYHPVHLFFSAPVGKFPATRRLQVTLSPRSASDSGELDFDLMHPVELPQGARSYETTAYVPRYHSWDELTVRIFEEGTLIDTAKATFSCGKMRLRYTNQYSSVGILSPRDASAPDAAWKRFPDVRTLTTVLGDGPLPEDPGVDRLEHRAARRQATSVQPAHVQFRRIDEDALPATWLGYCQLDIILVASPLLRRIQNEQPEQRAALDHWIAAGGNLWVYAAEESSGELFPGVRLQAPPRSAVVTADRLQSSLDLSGENDTRPWDYSTWQGAYRTSSDVASYPRNRLETPTVTSRREVFEKLKQANHPLVEPQRTAEFRSSVRHGTMGAGTVTTIAADDPFPGSFLLWRSIQQMHDPNRLRWRQRNGVDVPSGNATYWSFLIESLGQPPVKAFILLNTLFVLAIGPFCYFFFRRRQRLYLLFFVAPAVAAIVTGSLFAYALVADGIRTRERTRTVTWIDPHSGYACSEIRHTYYAVFNRQDGLRFPRYALVLPVRGMPLSTDPYSRDRDRSSGKRIRFTDRAQRFQGAFLPAREQVQYLTREPIRDSRCLRFDFTSEPTAPTIENPFAFPIERLLVYDPQFQHWSATDIDPGSTAPLRRVPSQARDSFADVVLGDNMGPVPTLGSWSTRYSYRRQAVGRELTRLDQVLNRWVKRGVPQNCFIAVAGPPGDTLAVDSAIVVDQVHVMLGAVKSGEDRLPSGSTISRPTSDGGEEPKEEPVL